jgi:hypothetical protein
VPEAKLNAPEGPIEQKTIAIALINLDGNHFLHVELLVDYLEVGEVR